MSGLPQSTLDLTNYRETKTLLFDSLADRTVALLVKCGVRRCRSLVVCRLSLTLCIVAKRCVLEPKILLTAYRKSSIRHRLVPKRMTLTFV